MSFPWFVWTYLALLAAQTVALAVCIVWERIERRQRRLLETADFWDGWLRSVRTAEEARR